MDVLCYRDLSKIVFNEYHTASGLITTKPCFLYSGVVSPADPATASLITFHNGEVATSDVLLRLASQYASPAIHTLLPLYFSTGLYIVFDTNIASVTLQYAIG